MNSLNLLKDTITIDGETYFHYSYGGKYTSTKFIVWDGIHYYNSDTPPTEENNMKIL